MPLHLLGKKSWNVYNADNIARVRRDEAAAKAAEEAEEQRMQEIDAQRRLAILRGEEPPPLEDAETRDASETPAVRTDASFYGGHRKKRKRHGEDDTDFELRLAKERDELAVVKIEAPRKPTSSAPIVDHDGHIDLFGDEKGRAHTAKNEEAEKESKKKKQEYEDQYTMRFANATGKHGTSNPWYSHADLAAVEPVSKNVWGNEDPRRKEREAQRTVANDPLAMMKKGASKMRELKHERKKIQEERDEELRQLRREERHREKRRRRYRDEGRARSSSPHSDRRRNRSRESRRESDVDFRRRSRHDDDERRRKRDPSLPDKDRRERHQHRRHSQRSGD